MRLWRVPLDQEKFHPPHGRIYVIVERCKGCEFCVEYCPRDVLRLSERYNKKGYHYPEAIREGACVDCNLCEVICPEFAIFSAAIEEPPTAIEGTESAAAAGTHPGDAPAAPREDAAAARPAESTEDPAETAGPKGGKQKS